MSFESDVIAEKLLILFKSNKYILFQKFYLINEIEKVAHKIRHVLLNKFSGSKFCFFDVKKKKKVWQFSDIIKNIVSTSVLDS